MKKAGREKDEGMDDKCPFCGAAHGSPFVKYDYQCGTEGEQHLGQVTWRRSDRCYEHQLANLRRLLGEAVGLLNRINQGVRLTDLLNAGLGVDELETFLNSPEIKDLEEKP